MKVSTVRIARTKERRAVVWLPLFLLVAAGLSGCSKKDSAQPELSGPVQTIDQNTVGEITGMVSLEGSPPEARKIIVTGEPECAQLNPTPLTSSEVVTGDNGALANVAVYVKSGLGNYYFDPPAEHAKLAQKKCMYQPRVIALMTHQTLDIQNEDPIQHNVHPSPRDNPAFNTTQPINGPPIEKTFDQPESAIKFMCNLHPWMRAYVFVFSNPYFDITSKTGTFDLKNLPPGTYTIEAWQEKYGVQDQTVTVGPKETKSVKFTFRS
jgi:hypothetical protein